MAGEETLKKLSIVVAMQDKASEELKKLNGEFKKFTLDTGVSFNGMKSVVLGSLGAIAAGGVAAGGAMAAMAVRAAEQGEAYLQMSQQVGMGVQAMSEIAYAAERGNVPVDTLKNGLKHLAASAAEAASGNKESAAMFSALGVSVTDASGRLKSTDILLAELADRFAGMEDGGAKTAAAMKLMGKAGEEMIPFLNEGSRGMDEMRGKARALGLVWTDEQAKGAKEFNDKLGDMKAVAGGLAMQMGRDLIPSIVSLTDSLTNAAKPGGAFVKMLMDAAVGAADLFAALAAGKKDTDVFISLKKEQHDLTVEVKNLEEQQRLAHQGLGPWGKSLTLIEQQLKGKRAALGHVNYELGEMAQKTKAAIAAEKESGSASGPSPKKSFALPSTGAKDQADKELAEIKRIEEGTRRLIQQQIELTQGKLAAIGQMESDYLQENARQREGASAAMTAALDRDLAAHTSYYAALRQKERGEAAAKQAEADKQASENATRLEKQYFDRMAKEADTEVRIREMRRQMGMGTEEEVDAAKQRSRDARMQAELANEELTESQKAAIREKYRLEDLTAEEDAVRRKMAMAQTTFNAIAGALSAIAQLSTQNAQQQAATMQQQYDAERATQQQRLKDKQITQEQYNAWESAAAEELAKKKNEVAKGPMLKAFQMQQVANIAQAMMNTFTAATAALALGPIAGPIAAAAMVAAGLAQVEAIRSQKPPAFAEGGIVDRDTLIRAGERGPEAIVPLSGGRSIPVDMRGGSSGPAAVTVLVTINNVVDPAMAAANPADVTNIISADVARRGPITTAIRKAAR